MKHYYGNIFENIWFARQYDTTVVTNDDQLSSNVVARTYIQHLPLTSIINDILDLFHYVVLISG